MAALMDMLAGGSAPELDYLVVIAGIALIQSGTVDPQALRQWMKDARGVGRAHDVWAPPLESALASRDGG